MAPQPLDIVVRFSTSVPDLSIAIRDSKHTSILSLKQRIRENITTSARDSRLRLIHAGKVLADHESLSRSLGNVAAPPSSISGSEQSKKSEKARGKLPVRESVSAVRVYIHCSIGDVLSQHELNEEKAKAAKADAALLLAGSSDGPQAETIQPAPNVSTTPAPRGFDRLLSTGFTPAEVASLRTQFLAIQAHTHTPDTMPTGAALAELEERWLEQPNATNAGAGGAEELGGEDGLEDMLWGSLIGFFWPVGVMCWLMREEGIWSRRRQLMVLLGFFINLMFGFLRLIA